jgi:hypothetical protein
MVLLVLLLSCLYFRRRRGRASAQGPAPEALQVLLGQMQYLQYNHQQYMQYSSQRQ